MLFFTIRLGHYHSLIKAVNAPEYRWMPLSFYLHSSFTCCKELVSSDAYCTIDHHRNEEQRQVEEGVQV